MDNQKLVTLHVVLKGNNYLLWSTTTKTALRSRGLWEHVEGTEEPVQDKGKKVSEGEEGAVESPL